MTPVHFGTAGHFIASNRCRFHLHTHVGRYCISTVGEFFMCESDDEPTEIGHGRTYETAVFAIGDDGEPDYGDNIDFAPYNDRDAANAGHAYMVAAWSRAAS